MLSVPTYNFSTENTMLCLEVHQCDFWPIFPLLILRDSDHLCSQNTVIKIIVTKIGDAVCFSCKATAISTKYDWICKRPEISV